MTQALKIFVNYRRIDSQNFVEKLFPWLVMRFGIENVFVDYSSIPEFEDFPNFIRQKVRESDIIISVIGPKWVEEVQARAARGETDYVLIELEEATQAGKIIAPICVQNASMPAADLLPEPLRRFAMLNAAELPDGLSVQRRINGIMDRFQQMVSSHGLERSVPTSAVARQRMDSDAIKSDVFGAIEHFTAAYDQKEWAVAITWLEEISATDAKIPSFFPLENLLAECQTELFKEEDRKQRLQVAQHQYRFVVQMLKLKRPHAEIQAALNAVWEQVPDYDPENIVGQLRELESSDTPPPPAPQAVASPAAQPPAPEPEPEQELHPIENPFGLTTIEALHDLGSDETALNKVRQRLVATEQQLAEAELKSDVLAQAIAHITLAMQHSILNNYRLATDALEKGVRLARQLKNRHLEAMALLRKGNILARHMQEVERVVAILEQALQAFQEVGDPKGEADTLHAFGHLYQLNYNTTEALTSYYKSLSIYREIGDQRGQMMTHNRIAVICLQNDRTEQGIENLEEAARIVNELGFLRREGQIVNNLGLAYERTGKTDKAIATYIRALEIRRKAHDIYGAATTLNNLALYYQESGQFEVAERYYTEFVAAADEAGADDNIATGFHNYAILLADHLNQPKRALEMIERALYAYTPQSPQRSGAEALQRQLKRKRGGFFSNLFGT